MHHVADDPAGPLGAQHGPDVGLQVGGRWTEGTGSEFTRLRVLHRPELVTFGVRVPVDGDGVRGTGRRLSPAQLEELQALLDIGPAAWGWAAQCWTLPRIAEVVRTRFGVDYTLPGLDLLLHRLGWSVQVPARQAAERDEERITAWREESWPEIKERRQTWAPGWSSKTSPARG